MERLLERFVAEAGRILPVEAVWAHGSLALGDFRPGRSDLDMIALVSRPLDTGQRRALKRLHQTLDREPAGEKLHCSYVPRALLADVTRPHVTWAQRRFMERPVGLVTRRELLLGAHTFTGTPARAVVPEVSDERLRAFILDNLRDYWYPSSRPAAGVSWLRDIWVDLGPLTVARARITLREGRLVTKGEALGELTALGAPALVLADIRQRRYGAAHPAPLPWRVRRGSGAMARRFTHRALARVLAENGVATSG